MVCILTILSGEYVSTALLISDLKVAINDDKNILNGVGLAAQSGEIHAIMGPNGSGKSTLAFTLMGHPAYKIMSGSLLFDGVDLNDLSPDKRAKMGIFLAFQYPHEVEGVRFFDFLRQSYNSIYAGTDRQLGIKDFRKHVYEKLDMLKMSYDFVERSLNCGFSGGEKKRAEILQLAVLSPKLVILDEIDSGLDVDALGIVCEGIKLLRKLNPDMIFLIITHYQRILSHLNPDVVHVMHDGKIVRSGGPSLAVEIENQGYRGV